MPKGMPKADKPRLDPLLAALVGKLPASDAEWSAARRDAWLSMMRAAFDVVYGPSERPAGAPDRLAAIEERLHRYDDQARVPEESSAVRPETAMDFVRADMQRRSHYHIDPAGYAKCDDAEIDAAEIPAGTVLHDYRPQPVDPETDPIMWRTTGSKVQLLPRGVVIRPAAEPYAGKSYTDGVMS